MIEAVKQSLSKELYANASFLCERLIAEIYNEETRHMLAECYIGKFLILNKGENKLFKAYYVLKEGSSMANRYKLAVVCLRMQKFNEAEKALIYKSGNKGDEEFQVVGGAAGYYLLGTICEQQAKQKEAAKFYNKAVELDPTLWTAFERLCKLNPQASPETIFRENHPILLILSGNKDTLNKNKQSLNLNSSPIKIGLQGISIYHL